ncbi:MAG: TonB-dependent receptor, partial [Gammaproteobacteria bacterium]|nr:TonB-dependent receptor [Gammaproteobacteria bacterium]
FEKTDDSLTVDLGAAFEMTPNVNLFARIENLTDTDGIVARHPYGARPNKGRTAALGIAVTF